MKTISSYRILIVDDNPAIHQDFIKILSTKNSQREELTSLSELEMTFFGTNKNASLLLPPFQIDTALQGQEGVQKAEEAVKEGNPYALAFVDVRMPPGWGGIETIKRIWQLDASVQIVLCTAYSDYSWEKTAAELGQTDNLFILKKPFDIIVVQQLASTLIKKWAMMKQTKEYLRLLGELLA